MVAEVEEREIVGDECDVDEATEDKEEEDGGRIDRVVDSLFFDPSGRPIGLVDRLTEWAVLLLRKMVLEDASSSSKDAGDAVSDRHCGEKELVGPNGSGDSDVPNDDDDTIEPYEEAEGDDSEEERSLENRENRAPVGKTGLCSCTDPTEKCSESDCVGCGSTPR